MRKLIRIFCAALMLCGFGMVRASEPAVPRIALVMKALSNPFFSGMEAGAKAYAQSHDIHLESFGVERETDVDIQIGIIDNLIQKQFDAVVLAPADSVKLLPVLKKAVDAGIIVINIDNPLDRNAMAELGIDIPFVGSDNYEGSKLVGEYIKRKKSGKPCNILYIEGIRDVANADLRREGFKAGLKDSNAVLLASESAHWHADEAMTLTADWILSGNPFPDVIACANDSMALGARQGVDIAVSGAADVMITGYDNVAEVRGEIQNGRIHATIDQHPELMGAYGVRLAVQMFEGQEVPDYVATPVDLVTYDTFGKKVVLAISTTRNPFFQSIIAGASSVAALQGINMIVDDAQDDSAKQLEALAGYISDGVDLLIINPADTVSCGSAVELANTMDIPVITIDRNVMSGDVLSHLASDNYSGGQMVADYLINTLPDGGHILELQGILGTSATHDRGMGFNAGLEKEKTFIIDHQTADFDREKAKQLVAQLLARGQQYDAIFAHNDEMILGALAAVKEAGSTPLPVLVGFDATPEAVTAVKQGELSLTIAQEPENMGKIAMQLAADILRGDAVEREKKVGLKRIERQITEE
ncbi:MAG: hypothetical protein EOL87_03755 [Spartobacteria bacterium]|nr:hypothetical protein [Spartobacteria bacterium]